MADTNDNRMTFRPFVYWAQNRDFIFLKIDIRDAHDVDVSVSNDGRLVHFKAFGYTTAHGQGNNRNCLYAFHLPLRSEVQEQLHSLIVGETKVDVHLLKKHKSFWKSGILSADAQKLSHTWLKFDFERWEDDPDDQLSSVDEMDNGMGRKNAHLESLMREMEKEKQSNPFMMTDEEFERHISMLHSSYMFIYNMGMFIMYFYILCSLFFNYLSSHKTDFMTTFWPHNFPTFLFSTLFQYMDVLHSLTGLTKAGHKAALMQVSGRLFVMLIINGCSPCQQWFPVFPLILTYLFSEQFRYPYYALNTLRISPKWLTYLRYNMWLLLYPLGLILEGLIFLRSIPYYYESGTYSLRLPNALNFGFNFGVLLAFFTVSCFPYIAYTLLAHIHKQRKAKMCEMRKEYLTRKKKLK